MPRAALSTHAGFHGKIPAHGDFVGRGLPRAFLDPFVTWMDAVVAGMPARMFDVWSSDGAWRFALAPGVAGSDAVTGVLAASADRAGRAYPLVLAASVGDVQPAALAVTATPWLDQAATLARSARDERLDEATLERALAALALPKLPPPGATPGDALHVRVPGRPALAGLPRLFDAACAGSTLWWRGESLVHRIGLPPADLFAALLDGAFQARGWSGDA